MVIVITGNIASGKSTLQKALIEKGHERVIEYTTRPPRLGEKNGVDYHFIDDEAFDRMADAGEFAETLCVQTMYSVWKYGAKKDDLKDNSVLVCGPRQMKQLLDSGVPMLSVMLYVDRDAAEKRVAFRGDDLAEFRRRFDADEPDVQALCGNVDMVMNANNAVSKTMSDILDTIRLRSVQTAQPMDDSERRMYLSGDNGITPYLRARGNGMPKNPVAQIAWLLLCASGCGFCKVCREKPCEIKDGQKCTKNIADYIRDCVHAEDEAK